MFAHAWRRLFSMYDLYPVSPPFLQRLVYMYQKLRSSSANSTLSLSHLDYCCGIDKDLPNVQLLVQLSLAFGVFTEF